MIAFIFQLLACQDPGSPEGLAGRTISFRPRPGIICFHVTGSTGNLSCLSEPLTVVEVVSAEVEVVGSDTAAACPSVDSDN